MMKKLVGLFLAVVLFPLAACAEQTQFKEGVHYTVVSEAASSKPEVREFFSYYCPHCMNFEPLMHDIEASLPDGVKFQKNHVDFLRGIGPDIQFMLTKAVVVAKQLGKEHKISEAIFNYIHKQRATITGEKDIRNIFVLNGVDGAEFDKLMKSFSVNSVAKQMKKKQDYFAKAGKLRGVPAVIVNNKYMINPKELDGGNFVEEYKNLVVYLSKKS